ncbi:MAG: isochorismatase family protein [Emcibacteraceae bacterium]|nr:isochorismatase family protein [Emcibacteraceae bacterium]MDG1707157.1 isochorismatase family protein [Emcibacteraceae bacterium]MDG1995527.1 isochorismatase family protein [Emcibacteraceae bacterium]
MMNDDDLLEDYKGALFGGSMPAVQRPALILVDFVTAYLDPASPLYAGVEDAVESAIRILKVARGAEIPVIFTNVEYHDGGKDGGVFYQKVKALKLFDEGSPFGKFLPNLMPHSAEHVITKQYASAFFNTGLCEYLSTKNIDGLIITGLSTSGCVRATAVDACQYGFVPLVVRDAVGDRDPRPHEANLFDLQAKYAEVVSEVHIINFLQNKK